MSGTGRASAAPTPTQTTRNNTREEQRPTKEHLLQDTPLKNRNPQAARRWLEEKVLITPISPEDPISSADLSYALLLLCYSHKNIPKVVEESIKAVAICIEQANIAETANTIQMKVTETPGQKI